MNQEEWFYSEFGQYGFTLSPTMYDAITFCPMKLVQSPDRSIRGRIKITPELADDLRGWGMSYDHQVEELRELIRMEMRIQYPNILKPNDFKPKKELKKLNINRG